MSELPNLEKLHARGNKFTGLDDIPVLDSVTYLNLRDNLIETAPEAGGPSGMENLKKLGTYDEESRQYNLASLHKINMQGNPFVDDAGDGFKKEVLLCLEMLNIGVVNKDAVTEEDRTEAKQEKADRIKAAEEKAEEERLAAEEAAANKEEGEGEEKEAEGEDDD